MGTYDGGGSSTGGGTTNEMTIQDSFNYMLGEAGFPELSPDEYAYIQNNQYFGGQLLSYFYNNINQNNSQFLHWSINYFKNYADPNISPNAAYKQFERWFINGYSDEYRNKLTLMSSSEVQDFVNINKEIETSPYDEESIKETNEAFVAFTAYADIETMTEAQIKTVLNQCCPSIIIVPQAFINEKTKTIIADYGALRKLYPDWSMAKCFYEASRDTIHLLLDIGGTVPLIGEVCDITNGVMYTMSGDKLNAALSYASAIPFAGWGATASKFAVRTVHLANGAKTTLKFLRRADNVVTFGNRAQLRKVLGMIKGDLRQAHHILPWELYENPAIQKAALSSNAFHLNEALNGIPLSTAVHSGSHANYTARIEQYLNAIPSNLPPDQVYSEVVKVINKVKVAIQNNPSTPINQLIF